MSAIREQPKENAVYKNILIATDGSDLGSKAVDEGVKLAKSLAAKVVIVMVTEPWTAVVPGEMGVAFPIDDYEKGADARAAAVLNPAVQVAKDAGVTAESLHMKEQFPAEGIIEASKQKKCDLIVMSSHGRRGISRMLLGSQANNVVTSSSVPVLIIR